MKIICEKIQLIGFISLFFTVQVQAQGIQQKIVQYALNNPVERIYLHLDKDQYTAGETIWFKAYILNDLLPSGLSKNLYIDWIDEKGNVLKHTTSPVVNGITNGQIDLPKKYEYDYIYVKAYTRFQLNGSEELLYYKSIPIV